MKFVTSASTAIVVTRCRSIESASTANWTSVYVSTSDSWDSFAFANDLMLWLVGFWYWLWDKHRGLNRVTYETTVVARCKCHPQVEGHEETKIQAIHKLEAAVSGHSRSTATTARRVLSRGTGPRKTRTPKRSRLRSAACAAATRSRRTTSRMRCCGWSRRSPRGTSNAIKL